MTPSERMGHGSRSRPGRTQMDGYQDERRGRTCFARESINRADVDARIAALAELAAKRLPLVLPEETS